jgi:hypothetical protein
MFRRLRCLPLGLLAAAAPLFTATAAHAGVLSLSSAGCGSPAVNQTFLPWGDPAEYFLAPGGDFSTAASGWTLSGGDGFSLNGRVPSANSLLLPAGSSATTPSFCVGVQDPDIRFFATNPGSASSTLAVSVTFTTSLGLSATVPVGTLTAGSTWQPTLPVPLLANYLSLIPGSQTSVAVTFTPQGQGGSWQIDDLYVDPTGGWR